MLSRRSLLTGAALAPFANLAFAADPYVAGRQYQPILPPVRTSLDKIEVRVFFAYYCPHCIRLEPHIAVWSKTLPADVEVVLNPVAWRQNLMPFTQTYYALDTLGLLEKLHIPFFESVVYQQRPYNMNDAGADIRAFMVQKGVSGEDWDKAFASFSVHAKSRAAMQAWPKYGVDSTPSVAVGGMYLTGPSMVGTNRGTLECLNFLIEKVRAARRAA